MVVSVFLGKSFNGPKDLQIPIAEPVDVQTHEGKGFAAPGTFALVLLFLVAFVIFVVLNYGWLSVMWEVK